MSIHDVDLPTYRGLMLPTLRALDRLGGAASIEVLDAEVADVAELTAEQLAAEFAPDQTQTGSIVTHRLAWARTYLKKAGTVDNPESGQWVILAPGREYLAMPGADAEASLIEADRRSRRIVSGDTLPAVRSVAQEQYAPVYEVARRWRETSLGKGVSFVDPSQVVWTREATGELRRRFIESFDTSSRSFAEKLDDQLRGGSQEACLLMAELMYVHLLPLRNVGGDRKIANINAVGALAPEPFEVPEELQPPLALGMVNGGAGYNTNRYYLVSLLVQLADAWVRLPQSERDQLLADPWQFKHLLVGLPQERSAAQRNALLFLLYPDVFEDITSNEHKKRIVAAFPQHTGESADLDRQVLAIRSALTGELGDEFNWYEASVRSRWDTKKSAAARRSAAVTTVAEDLEALLPDVEKRLVFAQRLAEAIEAADRINPSSWAVSRRHSGLALNVASNRMLGVFPAEVSGFAVRANSVEDAAAALASGGFDTGASPYSFPGDVFFATVDSSSIADALSAVHDPFLEAIEACAVRNTPFRGAHSDEVVEEIEALVGRTLPRPLVGGSPEKSDQRAWIVRVKRDGRREAHEALQRGDTRVFWPIALDPGSTFDETKEALLREDPELNTHSAGTQAGNLHRFITRMQPGDLILMPDGSDLYFGTIDGGATFDGEVLEWVRPVVWSNADMPVERSEVSAGLYSRLRSLLTVTDVSELSDEVRSYVSGHEEVPTPAETEVALAPIDDETAEQWLVDRAWLQEIVDMLVVKKQVIFYGPPGTGKTYLAQKLASYLTSEGGSDMLVQFHPSYSYEDFVEGFRPKVNADGSLVYELKPGPLKDLANAARENPTEPYFLIIDEINRGNLAKIFGELYYLLEYRNQSLVLQYGSSSDDEFSLPLNLFVIGTMNTADRSIAIVDAAIRRRFYFVEFSPTEHPIRDMLPRWLDMKRLDRRPAVLLDELNTRLDDADYAIGPSYLMTDRVGQQAELERIWKHGIMPLLTEHFYGQSGIHDRFGLEAIQRAVDAPLGAADHAETLIDEGPINEDPTVE